MADDAPQLELHRAALKGHCYRMLGSPFGAEDAVQETMVRAWQALDRFEGRASLRTWLFRIATNVCLDALAERERRVRPREDGPAGTVDSTLDARPRTHWLETSVPAINSALQRARATLADRNADQSSSAPLAGDATALLNRYIDAFHRYDVEAMVALLREDAVLSMPPYTLWLQGRETISTWLSGRGSGCRGSRLVPVLACGGPAYAQYRLTGPGEGFHAWSAA